MLPRHPRHAFERQLPHRLDASLGCLLQPGRVDRLLAGLDACDCHRAVGLAHGVRIVAPASWGHLPRVDARRPRWGSVRSFPAGAFPSSGV
jgi:hypothetical protein